MAPLGEGKLEKAAVAAFFDRRAPDWDREAGADAEVVEQILTNALVGPGDTVLDVACGTGVLLPFYLKRRVASVTAIDLSPEMVRLARAKFPREQARILCADAETVRFPGLFDRIMVYNAFPHFTRPERLLQNLVRCLAPGGSLTIAHGLSRAAVDRHHRRAAPGVSAALPREEELARLMPPCLTVTVMLSDRRMYQVTGVKA